MSLEEVLDRVAAAADRSGRQPGEVTVVAVSKGHGPDAIARLHTLGHRDFGENRARELASKVDALPGDIRWHFVGPLQTNKVRHVRPAVVLLHSLDRIELAAAWLKGPGSPPPALIQVNVGRERQKHGFDPDGVESACAEMIDMGIDVVGVMAIPPRPRVPEDSRPHFAAMRHIRDALRSAHPGVTGLSIGMTEDFEVAVEEGATVIRVGRAIFDG